MAHKWIAAVVLIAACGGAAERPPPEANESHQLTTTVHEVSEGSASGNAPAPAGR